MYHYVLSLPREMCGSQLGLVMETVPLHGHACLCDWRYAGDAWYDGVCSVIDVPGPVAATLWVARPGYRPMASRQRGGIEPPRAPAPSELKSCLWRWLSLELGHAGQLARYRESRVHMLGAEQMPARMPASLPSLSDRVSVENGRLQLDRMGCSGN